MINIADNTDSTATDSEVASTATEEQTTAGEDSQVEVTESEAKEDVPAKEQTETETGSEDSFFDPNQVPEELKPAYKQMQAAFTKKTQEIAEARKASEELKADAEAYGRYKQYIPIIDEMLAGRQQENQVSPEIVALEQQLKEAGYSDEAVDMMKISAGFLLNQFNQNQQARDQKAWVDNKIVEAAKLDDRLNDTSLAYKTDDGESFTFGQLVEQVVASDPSWIKDPVGATRKAIKKVDALIGNAKSLGKEELSASAKKKASKFPKENTSPQSATATDRVMTVHEAYEEAKKDLGI